MAGNVYGAHPRVKRKEDRNGQHVHLERLWRELENFEIAQPIYFGMELDIELIFLPKRS